MYQHACVQVAIDPIHIGRTFAYSALGPYDPTARVDLTRIRKAFSTPDGPCVVEIASVAGGIEIRVDGPGAERTAGEIASGFARDDGYAGFCTDHEVLGRLHRRAVGMRLLPVPWLFDIVCSIILQQRIRFVEAAKSWRLIAQRYGEKLPDGLAVFPGAAVIAKMESWQFEELGVDGKRSRTIILAARELKRHPLSVDAPVDKTRRFLQAIPGIGPWSVETILGVGLAELDALPIGDLYLPHQVSFALTGQLRGSDEKMAELLEPYRGHRYRVIRLIGEGVPLPRNYSPRPDKYQRL